MPSRELSLGTIFTGRVDATFRREVAKLKSILLGVSTAQGKLTKGTTKAAAATKKHRKETRKLANEYTNVGKKISKVHGGFQRLSAALKVTASYGLAGTFLFGVINSLKKGTQAIVGFDQGLKNLQAITGATDAEIGVLGLTIKKVAATTKYSAQEATDAAILIGQAGFNAAESMQALDSVALLATGTLSNMATTADLLTTAIRAFQLNANESGKVADIFASAVNKSKLTIDKLRIAFNYIGPIAHKAGRSLEETAASAMLLANAGLRGSTIGTGFRQVIARLVAPTEKLRIAFKIAGADMDKLNPQLSDMETVIGELSKVVPNATRAIQLFGLRGSSVAAVLSEVGTKGFRKMLEEVYRVGVAFKMAEKQMEGLGVMAKNLGDKMGILAVAIGEGGVASAFRAVLTVLRPTVDLMTVMAGSVAGKMAIAFIGLSTTIMGVGLAFKFMNFQMLAFASGASLKVVSRYAARYGGLAVVVNTVKRSFMGLGKVIKAHPMLGFVTLISGAIVVYNTWQSHIEGVAQKLKEQAIVIDKAVGSLEGYRKKLEKAKEGSLEYKSIIARFIIDFPKLAESIDFATASLKEITEAVQNFADEKQDKKIGKLSEVVSEYEKRARRAKVTTKLLGDAAANSAKSWAELKRIMGFFISPEFLGTKEWEILRNLSNIEEIKAKAIVNNIKIISDNITAESKAGSKAFLLMVDELVKAGLSTDASFNAIHAKLRMTTKFTEAELQKYATVLKGYFDTIRRVSEESGDDKKGAIRIKDMFTEVDKKMEKTEKGWLHLWDMIHQKGDLAEEGRLWLAFDATLSKVDALRKKLKDKEGFDIATKEGLALTNALVKETYKKGFEDYKKTVTDETVLNEKAQLKRVKSLMEKTELAIAKKKGELAAIDVLRRKDLATELLTEGQKAKINKRYDLDRQKILDEIAVKNQELLVDELNASGQKIAAIQSEISALQEKRSELLKIKSAPEVDTKIRATDVKIVEKEKELEEAKQKIYRDGLAERLKQTEKFSDEYTAIMEALKEDGKISVQELTSYYEARARDRVKIAKEMYDQQLISAQKYYEALEELAHHHLMTERELSDKEIELKGSLFERFKLGVDKARRASKDWGDTMLEVGEEINHQIADNITGSLFDFIDGTKNAKAAFADFAESTLRWLAEIIIRQQILNMLQGIMPNLFSPGSSGGETTDFGRFDIPFGHKGGVVGEASWPKKSLPAWMFAGAPRFHKGLAADEFPAVLQKGETVVPKGQQPIREVEVNLTNETGMAMKADTANVRFDFDRMIIGVVMKGLETNMGFRHAMSSVKG